MEEKAKVIKCNVEQDNYFDIFNGINGTIKSHKAKMLNTRF